MLLCMSNGAVLIIGMYTACWKFGKLMESEEICGHCNLILDLL
jgi:hypothetical protein